MVRLLSSPILCAGDLKRADGAGAEPGREVWCLCHQPGHRPGQALCLADILAGQSVSSKLPVPAVGRLAVGQLWVFALKRLLGWSLLELEHLCHGDADACTTCSVTC